MNKNSPRAALVIGFLPLSLVFICIAWNEILYRLSPGSDSVSPFLFYWFVCIASAICGILASRYLFRRGTVASVLGGIALLLLNGFLEFCYGSWAVFVSGSFHF